MPKQAKKRKYRLVYRSAETGKFVSRAYADSHPKTTITQKVRLTTDERKQP